MNRQYIIEIFEELETMILNSSTFIKDENNRDGGTYVIGLEEFRNELRSRIKELTKENGPDYWEE